MTNPAQEAEAIRFGFDDITERSVRFLREVTIAQLNGHELTAEQRSRLIAIEEQAQDLRRRKAVLEGRDTPSRPAWLDPIENN